jgi:hypothetical protein
MAEQPKEFAFLANWEVRGEAESQKSASLRSRRVQRVSQTIASRPSASLITATGQAHITGISKFDRLLFR